MTDALWVVASGNIPPALHDNLKRDFTDEELQRIEARIHKTLAPANSQPQALFIFGPSAVGKTVLSDAKATELFGSPENAVEIRNGWLSDHLPQLLAAFDF